MSKSSVVLLAGVLLLAVPLVMVAQSGPPSAAAPATATGSDDMAPGPAFEVATIRPGDRSDGRRRFGTWVDDSGYFTSSAVSLDGLVQRAYGRMTVDPEAPKWVSSDAFDINAKVDDAYMAGWDKLSDRQRLNLVWPMVRRLLADRFQLKMRTKVRDVSEYALVQAKGGTKMKEVPAPPEPPIRVHGFRQNCHIVEKELTCMEKAVPMDQLLNLFAGYNGMPPEHSVVDETGLRGYYDYSFTVPVERDAYLPIQQIGEQLGLRFELRKVPRTIYVIESAERPTLDGAEAAPQ